MEHIESPFMRTLEEQTREYRRVQRLESALIMAVAVGAAGWVLFVGLILVEALL